MLGKLLLELRVFFEDAGGCGRRAGGIEEFELETEIALEHAGIGMFQ